MNLSLARDAAVVFAGACLAGVALAVGYRKHGNRWLNRLANGRKRWAA